MLRKHHNANNPGNGFFHQQKRRKKENSPAQHNGIGLIHRYKNDDLTKLCEENRDKLNEIISNRPSRENKLRKNLAAAFNEAAQKCELGADEEIRDAIAGLHKALNDLSNTIKTAASYNITSNITPRIKAILEVLEKDTIFKNTLNHSVMLSEIASEDALEKNANGLAAR